MILTPGINAGLGHYMCICGSGGGVGANFSKKKIKCKKEKLKIEKITEYEYKRNTIKCLYFKLNATTKE